MTILISALSVVLFVFVFWLFNIVPICAKAVFVARGTYAIIRDDDCDDLVRENEIQNASLKLLKIFLSLFVRGLLVLALSMAPIILADKLNIVRGDDVVAFLSRIDVIIVLSIALTIGYFIFSRK